MVDVDSVMDNHTIDLFSCPERAGFDYGRCENMAASVWEPKEDVLDLCPVKECVSEGRCHRVYLWLCL